MPSNHTIVKDQKVNPVDNLNLIAKADRLMAEGGYGAVMDALTGKQRKFAEEFVKDFNALAAVERSGFKVANKANAGRMGHTLKTHPLVALAIKHLSEKRTAKAVVDVQFVLNKIVKAIDRAEQEEKYNAAAILRGAELLGRHLNMFVDRQEITGKDGGPIQTQELEDAASTFASTITRIADREREASGDSKTTH